MGKRNKIRYQSTPKARVELALSGTVLLRYVDDERIETPAKGDLMVYPFNESLNQQRVGAYDETGFTGYFKADVFDGREWRLVLLNNIFPDGENHFSKRERPADTFRLIEGILQELKGRTLLRTYREHYTLEDAPEESSTTA